MAEERWNAACLKFRCKQSEAFCNWLPEEVKLTDRRASALETDKNTSWGSYFELPDLYFSEMDGDRYILKQGLAGALVEKGIPYSGRHVQTGICSTMYPNIGSALR